MNHPCEDRGMCVSKIELAGAGAASARPSSPLVPLSGRPHDHPHTNELHYHLDYLTIRS